MFPEVPKFEVNKHTDISVVLLTLTVDEKSNKKKYWKILHSGPLKQKVTEMSSATG